MDNYDLDPENLFDPIESFKESISLTKLCSDINLGVLWQYFEEIDKTICDNLARYQKEILKLENGGYFESQYDDWMLKAQNWDQFLYRSIIIMIHSIVEKYLNDYCEQIGHSMNSRILLNDLKGAGIKRAQTYLIKIGQMSFPIDDDNWRKLLTLSEVRNCIVHNDGYINNDRLIAEILNINGLLVNDLRELRIKNEYCKDIIMCAISFNEIISGLCLKIKLPH